MSTIDITALTTLGRRIVRDTDTFDVREDGEVIATRVAENIAWESDHDEWLDDDTHEVWDVALKVAEEANRA